MTRKKNFDIIESTIKTKLLLSALKSICVSRGGAKGVRRLCRKICLISMVLILLLLTGCGRETAKRSDEELLVGFSQLGSESGWRLSNTDSITTAAEKAGVHLMMNNANQSQEKQIKALPENILGLPRTNSTQKLAEIYTAADVFVNPTHEDNYPSTNLEAQACGTPVITYRTGGSPESVPPENVVECGDVEGLAALTKKSCV